MSATTSDRPRAAWFMNNTSWLPPWLFAVAIWGVLYWTWDWPNRYSAERRLCDQAVDALVHSKDPIELQRAGIIIPRLIAALGPRLEGGQGG
jgi:hypothetical protein